MAGTPIYDAMGNYTGITDETDGKTEPSPEIAKPAEVSPPSPKGGPIVVAKQIKFGSWTLYYESDNLWVQTGDGKKLQVVLFDPTGVTEDKAPNKLSDGTDGSRNSLGGNNVPLTGNPVAVVNKEIADDGAAAAAAAAAAKGNTGGFSIPNIGLDILIPLIFSLFSGAFFPGAKTAAEKYVDRPISDPEWNDLVAAIYAETGPLDDIRAPAWVAATILNRSRTTGMSISVVLNQKGQFPSVTATAGPSIKFKLGPTPDLDAKINLAIITHLSEIPKNNYYFGVADQELLAIGACPTEQKNGVTGTLVGGVFVYPGARWP